MNPEDKPFIAFNDCPPYVRARIHELEQRIKELTSTPATLTCVYCGHPYPEGTPPHGAQVLTDHIKVCPKHPMREAEARIMKLEAEIAQRISAWQGANELFKEGQRRIAELETQLAAGRRSEDAVIRQGLKLEALIAGMRCPHYGPQYVFGSNHIWTDPKTCGWCEVCRAKAEANIEGKQL